MRIHFYSRYLQRLDQSLKWEVFLHLYLNTWRIIQALLISLPGPDGNRMMFMCAWEPDSLCGVSFMLHSHWPWLSATLHIFTTLHRSPSPSLFSCTLPVIACQINVPLCSQAQKLSCHIQPLLPFFFLIRFSFCTPPPPPFPLWSIFPLQCTIVCSCSHPFSRSTHVHSCLFPLLIPPDSAVLVPCCLSTSACSVPSLEMKTTPLFPSISARPSRCVCLSFHALMFLHKSCHLS